MNNHEYHVASYIAQILPVNKDDISQFIHSHQGAEIHAVSDEGKLVFTLEGTSQKQLAALTDQIKLHPDILTLSPVYHQFLSQEQNS